MNKLNIKTPVHSKVGQNPNSVKTVQVEPERLSKKIFVEQIGYNSGRKTEGAIDGEWAETGTVNKTFYIFSSVFSVELSIDWINKFFFFFSVYLVVDFIV